MGADRILVMSKGRIVEQGTHQELLNSHGYYEELYLHSQGQKQEHEAPVHCIVQDNRINFLPEGRAFISPVLF